MVRSGIVASLAILVRMIQPKPCPIPDPNAALIGNNSEENTVNDATVPALLRTGEDVPPVSEFQASGRSPYLLTCDHYGRLIPRVLGDLGLPESERMRHIGWDIGIAGVAEALSKHLDAHLIVQRYSRLVIDCNRPPHAASSIPQISE